MVRINSITMLVFVAAAVSSIVAPRISRVPPEEPHEIGSYACLMARDKLPYHACIPCAGMDGLCNRTVGRSTVSSFCATHLVGVCDMC